MKNKNKIKGKHLHKVLFFVNGLVGFGGQERILLEAAKYFQDKKDVETRIVVYGFNKKTLLNYKHLRVDVLDKQKSNNDNNNKEKTPSVMFYWNRIKQLRDYLKQYDPQLVICQGSLDCMYMYFASFGLDIPYISYIHGSLFWLENEELKYSFIHRNCFKLIKDSVAGTKEFVPDKIDIPLARKLRNEIAAVFDYVGVKAARKTIVLTKQIEWEVEELYNRHSEVVRGCLDKKLLNYKPSDVSTDIRKKYNIPAKTKIILNIGRLDVRKRIDVLMKAFDNLCDLESNQNKENKNIILLLGGRGPDSERLEKLLQTLKHKDKIKLIGFVPDDEYFDHLAGCDIFAFPSWTTSGIPTYEALALGKKVIWTTEAEEPVLMHPNVYPADPTVEAFVEAINKALHSPLYPKPNLREHTWEKYFGKLFAIAERVSK